MNIKSEIMKGKNLLMFKAQKQFTAHVFLKPV